MNNNQVTDSVLVTRLKAGDEKSFEILYNRYRLQLYSYLNKMLKNQSALVDDLFQQTWIKVYKNIDKYHDEQKFISWLFRVSHNLTIDYFRKESRKKHTELNENLPELRDLPWQKAVKQEINIAVQDAINQLPEIQKEVILLRQQGVAFKKIATIQDVSINTVLGRMHYAVKKIQQILQQKKYW